MSLVFITGISGAGKSAVRVELLKRGFEAYDTDEDGFTSWYSNQTGGKVKSPDFGKRTKKWYKNHSWKISRERVEELTNTSKNKLIFLCGAPGNDGEVWDLFDKVISLVINDETLKQRISTRVTNDYGKAPHELEDLLFWNRDYEERYRGYGARIIDATKPLKHVTDEILSHVVR